MILLGGHNFNLNTDICDHCGLTMVDWIGGKDPQCSAKNQPCCNKPGYNRWNSSRAWWECSQCGMIKSNDPNYLMTTSGGTTKRGSAPFVTAGQALDALNNWKSSKCDHRWKSYTGLKETFEYCEVCDQKR